MLLSHILFIGVPGAGKGTQAKLLQKYEFSHISTGDLIRNAWKNNEPMIMPYKKKIQAGGFLPDELIFELIKKNVKGISKYVLDGAVRTLTQAKFAVKQNLIDNVIFFDLSKKESIKRLNKRRIKENRVDDNEEAIKKRFEQYHAKTEPVLEYLKKNVNNSFEINASPSIQKIHQNIFKLLKLK